MLGWPVLKWMFKAARDAAFPARCYGCGQLYAQPAGPMDQGRKKLRDGAVALLFAEMLCSACASIDWIESPLCPACGRPFETPHGLDHLCPDCLKSRFSFDSARAVGAYSQAMPLLVSCFKYRGLVQLAGPLGQLMWNTLVDCHDVDAFDWLIPVPLHWRRKRQRGFNQAELLMGTWPKLSLSAGKTLETDKIAAKALIRTRGTPSQTGLGSAQRKENLRRAFRVHHKDQVCGCRIMLVDDVLTTGATVDACAMALKHAGAAEVHVLTLARTV